MTRHFFDAESEADFTRAHRVRLLGQFAKAALSGREPSRASVLFVAGAISAWLESGAGDLVKDYFQVTRPKSHVTVSRLWRQIEAERRLIGDEGQTAPAGNTIALSSSKASRT